MDLPQNDQAMIERELFGTRPAARARFYPHAALNGDATEANGFQTFDDKVYVEIRIPDSTDFVSRPATPDDFVTYPQAYAHFERIRDWKQHSLDLLPGVPLSKLATLRSMKIHTIEQLAAHAEPLPDLVADVRATALRFMRFFGGGDKPRLRLVDGALVPMEQTA
jgi:hypothetical protein